MPDNGPRHLARIVRETTNGGVEIVRGFARVYREENKRVSASAAKQLRSLGFDPETVDSISDEEIKKQMDAQIPPALK